MITVADNTLWASLPMAGILVDNQDCIKTLNPAAEVLLNSSNKSLAGHLFSSSINVETSVLTSLTRARAGRGVLVLHDISVGTKKRANLKCNIQVSALSDGSGDVIVLLQPRQIAGQLGQALQADSAIKTAIGLSDMLAHEIKNPLAGITGAAQLIAMNLHSDDLELTDLIVQESRRILGLLEQVEQFGDLRPPQLLPMNIHDVLETTRVSAQVGYASKMQFTDNYDPSLPLIHGDHDQLVQVFSNLFRNATQAAENGRGAIQIRTFFEQGLRLRRSDLPGKSVPLQIEISDDGPGIPASVAERLFEPFISGRDNGTGLGLALVSKIVAQHNGSVVANSKLGKTVFRISLPVYTPQKESP